MEEEKEEDGLDIVSATEMTGFMPALPADGEGESEFLTLCKIRRPKKEK